MVAATGCLTSDDADGTINNTTNNTSNNTSNISTPSNPINNSSDVPNNATAYLTKQMRMSDDKKSMTFVFDESSDGDKWELVMAPEGILILTEDEHIIPIDVPDNYPGIRRWVFESGSAGKTILNFNYIVEETGKSINNIIYIIEVDGSGEITIISTLYERL